MKKLPIYFAPLQGYTEAPFRNAHAAVFGGIDAYYTPFVRIEKGDFRRKDVRDIEPFNNTVGRLIPQLLTSSAEKAEQILSLFLQQGYKEADINLGCPFPPLAKRHNGSGILPYPEEVKSLLAIIHQHPDIRFSLKMRLGWESPDECLRLLPIINELPLRHVTLHPRLGKQQYKGRTDREGFSTFLAHCSHPVVYNGDIRSVEDIHRLQEQFPTIAGIMMGRGLLAYPALAYEYKQAHPLTPHEMIEKLATMHNDLYRHYAEQLEGGEAQLLNKMKTFWEYLLPQADKKRMKAIHKSTDLHKYQYAVDAFFHQDPLCLLHDTPMQED